MKYRDFVHYSKVIRKKYLKDFAYQHEAVGYSLLDKNNRVIETNIVSFGSNDEAEFDMNKIYSIISNYENTQIKSLVLFHTHPNNNDFASETDISTTLIIKKELAENFDHLNFEDHIIITENSCNSLRRHIERIGECEYGEYNTCY